MLLHEWLESHARERPDKVALVSEGQRLTYRDIDTRATRLAATLQSRAVQRGDRVAIYLDNCSEAVISIFAVLKAGAVFMPVNPQTKADKLAYLLNDSGARALISHGTLKDIVTFGLNAAPGVTAVVMAECADASIAGRDVVAYSTRRSLTSARRTRCPPTIDQDLASIVYTSGSTGEPKGVMLSHLNMVSAATSISTYLELRDDDIIFNVLPLAFDYGLYQVLMSSRVGATVVLHRSLAFPIKILEAMARERITVFPGVPTAFSMLLNIEHAEAYDLQLAAHCHQYRGRSPEGAHSRYSRSLPAGAAVLDVRPHRMQARDLSAAEPSSTAVRSVSAAACRTRKSGSSTRTASACPTAAPVSSSFAAAT